MVVRSIETGFAVLFVFVIIGIVVIGGFVVVIAGEFDCFFKRCSSVKGVVADGSLE